MLRSIRWVAVLALAVLGSFTLSALVPEPAQAGRPRQPAVAILAPAHGSFVAGPTVQVVGVVQNVAPGTVITVNGVPATLNPDFSFSATVPLNATLVFNSLETLVWAGAGAFDRRVVIAGDSVADGDLSLDALALRINDSGLDRLEPVVTSLVDLDLATLVPPGRQVIDEYCYARLFGLCIGTADAFVEGSPPPSIGSFSIDMDAQPPDPLANPPKPGFVYGDILLNDLFIRTRVTDGSVGIGFTCYVNVDADTTDILGDFALDPMDGAPQYVDVTQLAGAEVVFGGFDDTTDCAGIFGGVLELFIGLLIGDIQDLMQPAFEAYLNQPDLVGNTPVAGAIEAALSDISIAGPVGEGLGVQLDAPLFAVEEDADGLTLGSDARVMSSFGTGPGQCTPPPGAPDLPASYHVSEAFPSFGATTPVLGLAYDLGIAISTSAFNQLLKAQTECGLLQAEIREFQFGEVTVPLTGGALAIFLVEFGSIGATPLVAVLQPTTAPLLTGNPGPAGEDAELRVGHLVIDIRRDDPNLPPQSYLKIAVSFPVGIDFQFDSEAGELLPVLSAVAPLAVKVGLLSTAFPSITPADVQNAVPGVVVQALPALAGTLGSFPIPGFFGFQLNPVETGQNGEFLSIFANLQQVP
jgi:hypothetical protein